MKYEELLQGARDISKTSQINLDDSFQREFLQGLMKNIFFQVNQLMDENGDDTPVGTQISGDLILPFKTLENIGGRMDLDIKEYSVCVAFQDLLMSNGHSLDLEDFNEACQFIDNSDFLNLNILLESLAINGNSSSPLTEFSKKAININNIDEFTKVLESVLVSNGVDVILKLPPVITDFIHQFKDLIGTNLGNTIETGNNNSQLTH